MFSQINTPCNLIIINSFRKGSWQLHDTEVGGSNVGVKVEILFKK